jgi:TonB family protein
MWGRPLLIVAALFTLGAKKTDAEREAQTRADAEALMAALDPAKGPPLREPVFAKSPKKWAALGPPGGYFPAEAAQIGQGGAAVLQCAANAAGQLDDCRVLIAAPADFGFDDSARRMAQDRHLTVAPPAEGLSSEQVRVLVKYPRPGTSAK